MNAFTIPASRIGDSGLADRLRRETEGEVLFGAGDRGRYATDASIYQIEPVGVLVPRRIEDVEAAMAICREEGVPVLPRGAGTSQCGQTVNRALVIDCTKHLRRVLSVDAECSASTRCWQTARASASATCRTTWAPMCRPTSPNSSSGCGRSARGRRRRSLRASRSSGLFADEAEERIRRYDLKSGRAVLRADNTSL